MAGLLACNQEIGVRLPGVHLNKRKVAGYGSPGRSAKPRDLRVMWVQIPCLPLYRFGSMVKRKSHLASNETFQVQILVGLLNL